MTGKLLLTMRSATINTSGKAACISVHLGCCIKIEDLLNFGTKVHTSSLGLYGCTECSKIYSGEIVSLWPAKRKPNQLAFFSNFFVTFTSSIRKLMACQISHLSDQ